MRGGSPPVRVAVAVAAAVGFAAACSYDFDQFAAPSGAHPAGAGGNAGRSGGGAAGSGGGSSTTMGGAGTGGATAGAAGSVDGGGMTAGGAGGAAGAGGSATAGRGGGGNGGGGAAGTSGSGGAPAPDASDSGGRDASSDGAPQDAGDGSVDAGFDCASVSGIVYQGHCYFGRTGPFTWDVAATSCPFGAHLVTITSSGEQAVAQQILPNQDRWIGMREPATAPNMEQFYYWVTGEPFTPGTSYTNWDVFSDADREPNFTGDCVRMEFNSKWADDGCTKAYSAICERE